MHQNKMYFRLLLTSDIYVSSRSIYLMILYKSFNIKDLIFLYLIYCHQRRIYKNIVYIYIYFIFIYNIFIFILYSLYIKLKYSCIFVSLSLPFYPFLSFEDLLFIRIFYDWQDFLISWLIQHHEIIFLSLEMFCTVNFSDVNTETPAFIRFMLG